MQNIDPSAYIDHTLLDRCATTERVIQVCEEAQQYHFPRVCVYPCQVRFVVEQLHRQNIAVVTVIGFPTGASTSATKIFESQEAVDSGATELDVTINLGWLKEQQTDLIYRELAAIRESTGNTVIKAILEMELLSQEELKLAMEICTDVGVTFLKTGTGLGKGVTADQVKNLRSLAKGAMAIKAAGGIKTVEQVWQLIDAGATRLGTSYGPKILQELAESEDLETN